MTLRWNPLALVTHNQIRLPRIVHHAAHVALGLPFAFLPIPLWARALLAALFAAYMKRVWIDWHRTSGRLLHLWVPYELDLPDFIADLGFTLLGAILPPPIWWLAYYPLSVVSDP
jgi:hypothetical protein